MQLRLELAESPAPAAALWELVGEQQRQSAMSLLAAMIAQTIVPEPDAVAGDDRVPGTSAGAAGRQDVEPSQGWRAGVGDSVLER